MGEWADPTDDPRVQLLTQQPTSLDSLLNSGLDLGTLMQVMQQGAAAQAGGAPVDADPEGAGVSGPELPASYMRPLGPTYQPSSASTSPGYSPEVYYPHAASPHAPRTKGDWLQALMPAMLGVLGSAFGGKAGAAGALQGYAQGQQQDLVNAQRQQGIDQQRAVLEANERRYAEMDRLRQENNDRLKAATGSTVLNRVLTSGAQLNDPTAQAAFIKAHAKELEAYGYDLSTFAPEISAKAEQRHKDWARKALKEAVATLIQVHGPGVDLGDYFSENPPAKYKVAGGSMTLRDLATQAGEDPNQYIVSPDELKKRARTGQQFTAPVQAQIDDQVDAYKQAHGGHEPDVHSYAQIVTKAQQIAGEAGRAPTTLEIAQEMAGAKDLPADQAIDFLSTKSGVVPQELRQQAEIYARGNDLTNMGFGGLIPRQAIMSAQAALYPNENIGANKAQMHAHKALLDNQVKAVANLNQFEDAAKLNMDFAVKMRAKAPDLGGSFWNTPVQALAEKGFGDEDVKAARAALGNAAREVERIVTDPLLKGHLTIYANKKADEILPPTATLKEVQAVMDVMRQDMANVSDSVTQQYQSNINWMNRPLMGPDGQYHDRQGNTVKVNGDGLMVDEYGVEVPLDQYGRPITPPTPQRLTPSHGQAPRATPPAGAAPPGSMPPQGAAAAPASAAPAASAAPSATPAPTKGKFRVTDPLSKKQWEFDTKEGADAFTQVLTKKRGF